MHRDFNRKPEPQNLASRNYITKKKLPWLMMIYIAAAVLVVSLAVYLNYKTQWVTAGTFSTMTHWFKKDKSTLPEQDVQLAANHHKKPLPPVPEEPIKFIFYSALADMQVPASENAPLPLVKTMQKSYQLADKLEDSIQQKIEAKARPVPEPIIILPIADAGDLERDFASHLTTKISGKYMLQVGIFSKQESAEKYKTRLQKLGRNVQIVNVTQGTRQLFRVQVGPYSDKQKANDDKNILKKSGIAGILRHA